MTRQHRPSDSPQCLAELVPEVIRLSRFMTRDTDLADDVAQEVLLNIWKRIAGGAKIDDLRLYAKASLRNRLRRPPRRAEELTEADVPQIPPDAPARLATRDVLDCMARMPGDQARLLIEFAGGGASYAELARRHNLPIGTVMSRIARARARLCHDLDLSSDHPVESLVEGTA